MVDMEEYWAGVDVRSWQEMKLVWKKESRKVEAAVMVGVLPCRILFPEFLSSLVNNVDFPFYLPSPMCLHLISY